MNEVPELTRLLTLIFFTFLTVCASSKESKLISDNQTATIIFAGDISFDGPVKYFAEIEKTCDYKRPFERVRKLLATADLRVANLESPLLKRAYGEKVPDSGKTVANCGFIDAVEGLKYAGFDIVQVANNHFADFGVAGVKSTIAALKKAGIAYVGMQDRVNKKTSQKPVIKTVNGLKIGFLSYCLNVEGCSPYRCENGYCSEFIKGDDIFKLGPVAFDKRIARNDIKRLSKRVDFTVVLMHWSKEYSLVPPLPIRQLAESLVVYGANLIIGSHPHVIQGHECHGDAGLAEYSLGNFLFPKHTRILFAEFISGRIPNKEDVEKYKSEMASFYSPTQLGMMFRVTVSKSGIVAAGYIPVDIRNEPETNCLQATPVASNWIEFCHETDLYCVNQRDLCISEASIGDPLFSSLDLRKCIISKA